MIIEDEPNYNSSNNKSTIKSFNKVSEYGDSCSSGKKEEIAETMVSYKK